MRFFARSLAFIAALALGAQPIAAQDASILRDAETEKLLRDMVNPLVAAAGMPKDSVDVIVISDPSLNAFVSGGQRIFVNSGLINAADNANQVQGVLAHELGHIVGGHSISIGQEYGRATKISVLSMLLGVAAALAGAGDAAMGAMALGQQVAYRSLLTYSRGQEATADAAGANFLSKAGISGRGSLEFFGKIQNLEFRYGYPHDDEAAYASTHPMSGERIATLRDDYQKDPAWDKKTDPRLWHRSDPRSPEIGRAHV